MNTLWNFIDETERHKELYNDFTSRERDVLEMLDEIEELSDVEQLADDFDEAVADIPDTHELLRNNGVSESELRWLERTGKDLKGHLGKSLRRATAFRSVRESGKTRSQQQAVGLVTKSRGAKTPENSRTCPLPSTAGTRPAR